MQQLMTAVETADRGRKIYVDIASVICLEASKLFLSFDFTVATEKSKQRK